jgi:hypothetical protein
MQKVVGGEIFVIDTESNRSLHYAGGQFKFRHLPFVAPFSPLDYLAAIEHCVKKSGKTIIIDSMSHEHEGPGGVLEMHDAETKRLAALWKSTTEAAQFAAWSEPKSQRQRLINTILQLGVNAIFCFRSKEKTKPNPDKTAAKKDKLLSLGWMPICGDNLIYEMTAALLLQPGSKGHPTIRSSRPGEQQWIKIPRQCEAIFTGQLNEKMGFELATWGAGKTETPTITDTPAEPRPAAEEDDQDVPVVRGRGLLGRAALLEPVPVEENVPEMRESGEEP